MERELDEQALRDDSACPSCGSEPKEDPMHRLSALGYTHDDIHYECSSDDCGTTWQSGVPIGEYEGRRAEELLCDSCGKRYGLLHWAQFMGSEEILLHIKCPNPDCFHYWKVRREYDEDGFMLMGYPSITGDVEAAEELRGVPDDRKI